MRQLFLCGPLCASCDKCKLALRVLLLPVNSSVNVDWRKSGSLGEDMPSMQLICSIASIEGLDPVCAAKGYSHKASLLYQVCRLDGKGLSVVFSVSRLKAY